MSQLRGLRGFNNRSAALCKSKLSSTHPPTINHHKRKRNEKTYEDDENGKKILPSYDMDSPSEEYLHNCGHQTIGTKKNINESTWSISSSSRQRNPIAQPIKRLTDTTHHRRINPKQLCVIQTLHIPESETKVFQCIVREECGLCAFKEVDPEYEDFRDGSVSWERDVIEILKVSNGRDCKERQKMV